MSSFKKCFHDKLNVYWPKIEEYIKIEKLSSSEIKRDSLYILIYSLTNLVQLVRQED